ncbi:uncharacterized protein LOC118768054 [Octopus sinensis]|uniref:Uncharacterized protein LOC118768054 n=1 Tax=Octopus sinensis TaxID=2607531 RepID=A0A7E6FQA0_9MOLL|nr:uncharacterized protein LOC118768054 [Octopus sinensis]
MARRTNSVRVRRRQSDAKWRASVANGYNTLKMITDASNKKKSKKKYSKAHILQETVNHINFLESILANFLSEKKKFVDSGLLPETSNILSDINEVRNEFSAKQAGIFSSSSMMRKCNFLDDLLNEIYELDNQISPETGCFDSSQSPSETQEKHISSTVACEETEVSNITGSNYPFWPSKNPKCFANEEEIQIFSPVKKKKFDELLNQKFCNGSNNNNHNNNSYSTPKEGDKFLKKYDPFIGKELMPIKKESTFSHPSSSDILQFSTFETPKKKHDISGKKDQENFTISGSHFQLRQLSCGTSTFTPLKSPPIFDLGLSPITTPCIKQLNNYLPCGLYVPSPDNDANKYLICNENINEIDKVTSSSVTKLNTSRSIKHGTTCRKRLDKFFTESKQEPTPLPPDNYLNKNTDSLDFDGYFFFYKQIVEEMKHRPYEQRLDDMDIASKVSKMWRGLSAEQKKTLMTLAALEKNDAQCSKLTDDLQNVDVKKVIDIDDIDDAQLFSRNTGNGFQIVPEMNLQHSKDEGFLTTTFPRDVSQNYSHCEVPEYNPCKIFQSPSLTALNWSTNHCTWKANINNQSTNNSSICSSHKMDFDNESELVPTWGEEV